MIENEKVLRIWKKKGDQTYCVLSPKPLPQIYKHYYHTKHEETDGIASNNMVL